ncbi:hypothetical protein Q4508_00790 [Amphritea sp. 2_MG-2023]|uniref:hypothetical protein n=1 Tax=Amphritea TaxID=515417 RepID=UPI001C0651D4|nr:MULTISPECIES: hypothetical protein [Amphritea]MBU2964692.1 hypothetical protein [Amphritea atlantica]MDO6417090.1 hypothetical protein [Amphritea sp. 2_MG-2023]
MKKFELHLDALIVIVLLFVLSLGVNFVLYKLYSSEAKANVKMQVQSQVDQLNLASMEAYIKKIERVENK